MIKQILESKSIRKVLRPIKEETSVNQLDAKIENVKNLIKDKKADIENYVVDKDKYEDEYIELLNSDGPITVAGIQFYPADILKEMDPTAYQVGLDDYLDSMDNDTGLDDLNSELSDLESELEDLEDELDELKELAKEEDVF